MISLAAATLGGAALSGAASLFGGSQAASSAKRINAQQIALTREQMQFQERMSNTAYQRSTKDLKAAGLNRILALGSPSSSPGGAQPPKLNVPGEHIQRGITSALQNANVGAQIALLNAQAKKVTAEGDILAPKAIISGEVGDALESALPDIKGTTTEIFNTAKGIGSAAAAGSIPGIGTRQTATPKGKPKSTLTLVEQTFSPSRNLVSNVASWAARYEKVNGKKPSRNEILAASKKIKAALKGNY